LELAEDVPQVFVVWDEVEDAVGYEIFVKGPGRWKVHRQGGWRRSLYSGAHVFFYLMPGERYTIRVRAIADTGLRGKASKKFIFHNPPCWVWKKVAYLLLSSAVKGMAE